MTVLVQRLPAFDTNYLFLLYDRVSQTAAMVDPGDLSPVQQRLHVLGATLTTILNTHHHRDHVGANLALLERYPQAIVYGGEGDRGRIPGQHVFLRDGDRVSFGGYEAEVLFVPGHTRSHIAYYFPKDQQLAEVPIGPPALGTHGDLFCGDTLFGGGCGRLFEGTPAQMLNSLDRFRQLPEETRVWCAHEYTLNNLKFALTVEPENQILQARYEQTKIQRQRGESTIPSTIALEKQTNPFLRWDQKSIQTAMGSQDPVETVARLRAAKDRF